MSLSLRRSALGRSMSRTVYHLRAQDALDVPSSLAVVVLVLAAGKIVPFLLIIAAAIAVPMALWVLLRPQTAGCCC